MGLKKYIIKSNYEYEIEATCPEEAIEKFQENVEDELASSNRTLITEFIEYLVAEEVK